MTKSWQSCMWSVSGALVMALAAWSAQGQPIERPQVQTGQPTPWLYQYPSDRLPPAGRGLFKVRLMRPKEALKNGPLQDITISISGKDGRPVSNAAVQVTGRPRDLRRFLPTVPRVQEKQAPGMYDVTGLRFTMSGRWLLEFDISQGKKRDKTRLEITVD